MTQMLRFILVADQPLLESYVKAQACNILIGNQDTHGNNFIINDNKCIPIDFGGGGNPPEGYIKAIKLVLNSMQEGSSKVIDKWIEDVVQDFKARKDEILSHMQNVYKELDSDSWQNSIEKNLVKCKEIAGIQEQKSFVGLIDQQKEEQKQISLN